MSAHAQPIADVTLSGEESGSNDLDACPGPSSLAPEKRQTCDPIFRLVQANPARAAQLDYRDLPSLHETVQMRATALMQLAELIDCDVFHKLPFQRRLRSRPMTYEIMLERSGGQSIKSILTPEAWKLRVPS